MNITTAKTAGFCFGVQRAIDKVYDLLREGNERIFTLGPLIHNEEVVRDLEEKGVHIVDADSIGALDNATVVIRSHGAGEDIYRLFEEKGLKTVDATCPFVLKIHRIVKERSEKGDYIVIIGDSSHPEVQGICGWCRDDYAVIKNAAEAEAFEAPESRKLCVVSQTTFNLNKFQELVEIIKKKSYNNHVLGTPTILNTICSATEERQREAREIAARSDVMLVIGGRSSSNTQKLFEICSEVCGNTYYIQTPVDLDSEMFQRSSYVGITAGASTPKKIIEEVREHVRTEF
ncbi:MAG: 4-hydroxy-3-methylbut-2-enyl diphosphate reductase [Blautia sp.]|nr:4-hydroxy-3-methylbut-2-enyl diphosphate reductase [Blautia sp.]